MRNGSQTRTWYAFLIAAVFTLGSARAANAELYVGAGVGKADVEVDSFAEDDSSKKFIVGYIFDIPAVDFSLEASYIDFGTPSDGQGSQFDGSAIGAFAVAGVDFGVVGLFAKAGAISWDADAVAAGFSASDDGTDSAYGAGIRFNVGSFAVRTEYEVFNLDDADLDMASVSLIWRF
jgi:hypothetical protein